MIDRDPAPNFPQTDRERLALYRTLLEELRQANADMKMGNYRILKQGAGTSEQQDVTPEAIRTNQVSIVLLEGAIAMTELRIA